MSRSLLRGPNAVRVGIALAAVLAAATAVAGAPAPIEDPYDEFIPPGYTEIAAARSDFNGDGRPDLVLVLADQTPDGVDATCPLIVLLARPSGGWLVSARAKIDCTTQRGPHGSGFDKVTALRDTFLVRVYTDLEGDEARYQLRDGRWWLIGARKAWATTAGALGLGDSRDHCFVQAMSAGESCTAHEIDTNFLTGAQIETSIVDAERVRSVRRKVPVTSLQELGEWIPDAGRRPHARR
jgi:hypothetical protein